MRWLGVMILCILLLAGCADEKIAALEAERDTAQRMLDECETTNRNCDLALEEALDSKEILEAELAACDPSEPTCTVPAVDACVTDADCTLVIGGCKLCPYCERFELDDPRVIAVNKDGYSCAPGPEGLTCVACVDSYNFIPDENVECDAGRCVKK